jgi:hypothetical protein
MGPQGPTGPSSPDEVKNLAREARAGEVPPTEAQPILSLDGLAARDRSQDIGLKLLYGWGLLVIMVIQIGLADWVFIRYAQRGVDWNISPTVMEFWLSATVVETIGIVLIVTKYLFPSRSLP